MQFIEPLGNPSKVVVGTGYHQIRLYDMRLTSKIDRENGSETFALVNEHEEEENEQEDGGCNNTNTNNATKSQRKKLARAKHMQMNLNRPLFNVEVGEHPIKCISVCPKNSS